MMIRRKTHNGLRFRARNSGVSFMLNRTLLASGLVVASLLAVPASAGNWNGFYVGLHAGGATGDIDWTNVSNNEPATSLDFITGQSINQSVEGVLGGAQVGYNFQMSDWVFGIELAGSSLDFDETSSNPNTGGSDEVVSSEMQWLGTAALRLGYSAMDSLLYLKGGYATAKINTDHFDPIGTRRIKAGSQVQVSSTKSVIMFRLGLSTITSILASKITQALRSRAAMWRTTSSRRCIL
ncbi:MAG: outer membrane beta-barrel protein [Alphaproteobacteria bacterium]|nr:outer membrane beta-barrel protein [Alphaproteobacteria bacterium]